MQTLDVKKIRKDFPMFRDDGKRFAYLDTASSSQTPLQVLEAADAYYRDFRANVHRGMYRASEKATEEFEAVRRKVADFLRASEDEVIFTRGATEALNIAARGLAAKLGPGDEVVLTGMEHHANLVPWQQLAAARGFDLLHLPMSPDFTVDMAAARIVIGPKTKVVAVTYASNVLGTIVPVAELAALAHAAGATVVVDAAQAAGHLPLDVKKLGADLLAFSGHKMLAPTGTGALWGRKAVLEAMEPMLYGGDMIREVFWDRSTWNEVPWKFEAGTPNVSGVIGLGAAIDYVRLTGLDRIRAHERELTDHALDELAKVPGVRIIGPGKGDGRIGVVSFVMDGIHPHDVATILDAEGVCVRGGHHCAMPLMRDLGLMDGTTRASFGIYNEREDVDMLVAGLRKARKIFRLD